ncbi:MAG: signal peptidase I [archaeon]|nr:signal peptidase I [archaeon]
MRRIKREFVIFAYVLLAIFFFWVILGFVLKTDTPVVIISSGSMEPALSAGDVVFVRGTDTGDLRVGDVIVYNCPSKKDLCVRENELLAHRIVEINETNGIKTKGDANDRVDRWLVGFSWVKGNMFFRIPFLGKPIVVLRQIMGVV